MAVITESIAEVKAFGDRSHVVTWTPLANGDSGSPVQFTGSTIRSIQFDGTFGAGGSISLEGSNDGTTYFVLTDPQGNAITKTAAALEAVQEATRFVRPRVTAGDGTTSLSARLFFRKPF